MDFPTELKVFTPSASDQVVGVLRTLILKGEVEPGMQLREVVLSESFDVSRNTIREAIRQLVHEGLLRHDRHRSAVVVKLDDDDVADLYAARRVLEISAADRVRSAGRETLEAVQAAFARLEASVASGEWSEVVAADVAFHKSVVGLHGSPRLQKCFETIESELAYFLSLIRLAEKEEEEPERILAEHDVILQAVLVADAAWASTAVAAHLTYYEERAHAVLRDRSATG